MTAPVLTNAKDEQFSLDDKAQILFQEKFGSPLPGRPVAALRRGAGILAPAFDLLEEADSQAARERLQCWLDAHIRAVLEPLFYPDTVTITRYAAPVAAAEGEEQSAAEPPASVQEEKPFDGPAREIAERVREALGTIPREAVQDLIDKLDAEGRAALRSRKIRLGPILVFIPALNKPAAVKLRARLWAVYHGKPLPVESPADGIVSCRVDPAQADKDFYQSIGYPVYGGRAIRIDMLDRVIVAVYDSAENGVFKAQHQMAEWLGTPIEDLYAILEAMGHRKIHDPAAEAAEKAEQAEPVEPAPEVAEAARESGGESPAPKPSEKPELATFRLKRGRANEKEEKKGKREERFDKFKDKGKPEFRKEKSGKKKHKNPRGKEYKQTMMSAGPQTRPEDSPFAILEQLKKKS